MSVRNLALKIRNLQKRFRKTVALRNLDLDVPAGSVMGLVGPNGAGKTTAFAIIAGLLQADGGSMDFLGKGSFNPIKHKGLLTLLPQDAHIPGHSRVRETLVHFGLLQGLTRSAARKSADEILEWVDLTDRASAPVSSLSHGMIRRLTAAQAFIGNPELVLLDEPTSGLDPHQVVRIRDLIISRRGRQTIVVSSHILSEIEAACDHVAFIENGVTLRQDALDNIIEKSRQITFALTRNLESLPAEIDRKFPELSLQLSADGRYLKVKFTETNSPAIIIRTVLPALWETGIDVEEIHRGSDLEKIYLEDRLNNR